MKLVDQIRSETDGRGADVVVEVVGRPEVLDVGLRMLRRGGTYCETGNFVDTGSVTLNVHRHLAAKNVCSSATRTIPLICTIPTST